MIDYAKELNAEQLKAVNKINGPAVILAGAGSGKTRTMTYRAAKLIESGILAQNILMLTFTNKAANEMKERVIKLLNEKDAENITACTFHSFCVSMLRRFGECIDLKPNFTVLGNGEDEDVVNIVKSGKNKEHYRGRGFPKSKTVVSIISMAINKGLPISEVMKESKYESFKQEVIEIAKECSIYKKDNNLMNYDDLLIYMNELLQCENIAKTIAKTYSYIMVDEYQDTNPLQEEILVRLFEHTKNIVVVGDDLQSLYGFRGAEVDNIINFQKRFPGSERIFLTQNYRSSQEILDVANVVTSHATEGFPKELIGQYKSGKYPSLHCVHSQTEEAEEALNVIERTHNTGIPYNEICVLVRKSTQSAILESMFSRFHIPYVKYGGQKYLELSYVKDVLAYLRVLLNPYDELSWFRILQVHNNIGEVNARKIASGCKIYGFEYLLNKDFARRIYRPELEVLYAQLDKVEGLPLDVMLDSLINFYTETNMRNIENMKTEDEGYRTELLEYCSQHHEDLQKLLQIAEQYDSLSKYLDDMTLEKATVENSNSADDAVVLSTIHSVKGLEFHTVLILDCVDEIFPSTRLEEIGTKEDQAELRCFYVAVTRAKENLHMFAPNYAKVYGRKILGLPSHFLRGAENLIDCNDLTVFNYFPNYAKPGRLRVNPMNRYLI